MANLSIDQQDSTTYPPAEAAAISTSVTTARKCYDVSQKELGATDPDPGAYFRYNGDWACFDTEKNALVEREDIAIKNNCVMYWRPSPTSPVDQTVYVIGHGFSDTAGFANYGSAGYCTNWPVTTWPIQKEMRCWSNGTGEDGNLVWFGWANAQGMRGMPADPGKNLTLEPEITCSGIGSGEWKWRTPLTLIAPKVPAASLLSPASEKAVTTPKKKIPLIQLLKQKKK